eukprot:4766380-Amphidinium_carterae.2
MRVPVLGLPAHSKARIAKPLFSVGLFGAEFGGMSASHTKDVRINERKALGKDLPLDLNKLWPMDDQPGVRKLPRILTRSAVNAAPSWSLA